MNYCDGYHMIERFRRLDQPKNFATGFELIGGVIFVALQRYINKKAWV